MAHSYHDALPGFDPAQLLHDGCRECERRGKDVALALAQLDDVCFERAWLRAADQYASSPPSGERAQHISATEIPLLAALWSVQRHLQRHTGLALGYLPERPPLNLRGLETHGKHERREN